MINTERLLSDFLELLQTNSPSRFERAVAEIIASKLRSIGFVVDFDDVGAELGSDCGNIIATLPATAPHLPGILLCAHMDTVAPTKGMSVIQENGIIRQEGAAVLGADDKGGIAAIIEGVRSAVESGLPHGQIQALFLVCEEIGLLGSKALDARFITSDMGFVFDSGQPVAHLVTSAPTHDNLLITFKGRSAHAGVCPEEGISAIQAAAIAIGRMKLGRIDFETTANVGLITGGSARNIVPECCEVKAEARSRDKDKLQAQVNQMRESVEGAAREMGVEVSIEVDRSYSGYKHAPEIPLMEFGTRAAQRIGMIPELVAHGGGSDCNILNAKGLPTAVVGVGYERIHTPDEFIAVDNLVRCTEFAAALVLESGR